MKKLIRFLFYSFLVLVFVCLLFGVGYWAMEIKGWPWWISIVLVASCVGILFGFFAVKKYLIRRNEKKFVKNIINQEEAAAAKKPDAGDHSRTDVDLQWKNSIARLKKSHLRKFGNPLYVLPWYIIMGESRSGKTSAIKNANLSSALTDVSQATIVSGTKNCDWWFLEQAIVLDTAGRYTIPIEEEKDKKEWEFFLTQLSKYRKKEPINGVIVTVAGDTLLNEDDTELSDKAKSIRQRINQMMRILGARFPVYLLVTKMDLVNGFTDFCDHIPEQRASQVMGYTNSDKEIDSLKVLDNCMNTIFKQIRNLRSAFLQNRINNFAISFSNEFMALKPGLESYVKSLFGDDIYQATPFFRGIYFSSACRKGEPASEFLKATGIQYSNDASPDRNKGFFLKNLFNAILPKDRNIFTPLTEFIMWRRATMSLGIFSLVLICLALSGVLGFSYVNNMKALKGIETGFFKKELSVGSKTDQILIYDRQRFEIDKLENNNSGWILPRFGLNHSLNVEHQLKKDFVTHVETNLISPLDDLFFDRVKSLNAMASYRDIVDNAVYAVQRITILKAAIEQNAFKNEKAFEKSIKKLYPSLDPGISNAVTANFAQIYYAYLTWKQDKKSLQAKLENFQNALSMIAMNSDRFEWLLSQWICTTPNVEIFSFLKGYQISASVISPNASVAGAFTAAGRQEIKKFLETVQKATEDQEAYKKMEDSFWAWYAKEFYRAWFEFANVFPTGSEWNTLVDNWTDLGTLMTTDQNPYFLLLDKMAGEFKSFKSQIDLEPSWANIIVTTKEIKTLAETEIEKKKGSLLAKLSLTKDKLADKFKKSSEKVYKNKEDDPADLEYKTRFAKIWNDYVASLGTLSSATSYNEKCFQMFADFFKALTDPSKQSAPFNLTYENLLKFDAFLKQNEASPVIYKLVKGPFDYLTAYGAHQTEVYLQSKWEEIVLSAAYNVDPEKYYTIMFDKDSGIIWKFVNEQAGAFLSQNKAGFLAKTAFGRKLSFTNEFLRLLNKGDQLTLEQQDAYPVSITTLPVSVNKEAMIRAYSNTLTLECAEEKTELLNNNFPETQTFNWRPAICGDTVLQIQFEESVLKKKYRGKMGFAKFLYDFKDGTKVFNVADFPEHKGYLTNNNVTDITVSYDIKGIKPILEFLDRRPPSIPDNIFRNYQSKAGKFPLKKTDPRMMEPKEPEPVKPAEPVFKDKYAIAMEALPMGVNDAAKEKPIASIMWMKCNGNVIRFENNNYPESVSFDWIPKQCGKVLIIIEFPGITLLKEYPDFYEFAKDFKYHSRTFSSDEFPDQKKALMEKEISSVTLSYVFKGDLPRIDALHKEDAKPIKQDKPVIKNTDKEVPELSNKDSKNVIHAQDWISKQDENHYTVQVMMSPNKDKIIEFALLNGLLGNSAIYKSKIKGQDNYNLILGNFESYKDAKKKADQLSDAASKYGPWIRRFASIEKEME